MAWTALRLPARTYHPRALGVLAAAAVLVAWPAAAQPTFPPLSPPARGPASSPRGELTGVVLDDRDQPLDGAVISALGSTTLAVRSDSKGRFAFRGLAPGSYLLRVHLEGYVPARTRVVQVRAGSRQTVSLALSRAALSSDPPAVLAAGIGPAREPAPATEDVHEHGEVAWRLRHIRRSVLKEAEDAVADLAGRDDSPGAGRGRVVGGPARYVSSVLADLPFDGELNLLTTTSFDRPQDLFTGSAGAPRGIAYVALSAPSATGEWTIRGTVTQGDISSWMAAGSFSRRAPSTHQYQAGLSYSTQRYLGGNGEALAAVRDGARNVGTLYAFDTWTVAPRVRIGYGAKYATYDYLVSPRLFSPTARISFRPASSDSVTLHVAAAHRETAPGAEEFVPPTMGVSLPPERTFSHLSRQAFVPERLDHLEVGVEREWPGDVVVGVRVFHQSIDDQIVTIFGSASHAFSETGHYRVGSAGDVDSLGWGVRVSRAVGEGTRAVVDYTRLDSRWRGSSPDAQALAAFGGSVVRDDERVHDVTAMVESVVAPSSTRVLVVYKLNTALARPSLDASTPGAGARFNVEVSQELPFLRFNGMRWEMLMALSNLFHDELGDASVYDELLVVRPPTRVLGGVTVRF